MARYAQLYSDERVNTLLEAMGLNEEKDDAKRPYYRIGVGIGSITTKVVALDGNKLVHKFIFPTGLNSSDAAKKALDRLETDGFHRADCTLAATGIGQMAVTNADEYVEIGMAHGRGARYIHNTDGVVIDIGGQETEIMTVNQGTVEKVATNDRCSAAVGKFLEVTANRMGITESKLAELAYKGQPRALSSMCMVFVESELSRLIAQGASPEDVAWIAMESVVNRVLPLIPIVPGATYMITGGQCENDYLISRLSERLGSEILSSPLGRYAGVIGAALTLPAIRPKKD